jgi:hypothetical protein
MKEIKDKYWKGLLLSLETYFKARKILRDFLPLMSETKMLNSLD